MALAPHLPPPTCNIEHHHRMQRLKVLLVATVFGVCAGLSGAAMLVGWIWPTLGEGDAWVTSRSTSVRNRELLQDRVAALVQDTVFTFYSRASALGDANALSLGTPIGSGVGVLSQGWLVATLPLGSRATDLVVVGSDGLSYAVTEISNVKTAGISLVRIARESSDGTVRAQDQIHTVALGNGDISAPFDVALYSGGRWSASTIVDAELPLSTEAHTLGAPLFGYRLSDPVADGTWVFDGNGRLLGRMNKSMVVPLLENAQTLGQLVSGNPSTRPGLGVVGWYSEERPIIVSGQRMSGFYVSRADQKTTTIKKGDILLTINGIALTPSWWGTFSESGTVRVTLLRAGKTMEVSASVVKE